jgi:predicted nucleotidyltransferase component of viral defense system
LARLPDNHEWILKGGFALQLRYGLEARPTRDIDLRTPLDLTAALNSLRQVIAASPTTDHFSFELSEVVQELQGAPGGSLRVRVMAQLAGLPIATFHLDLSSGDALVEPPDVLHGSDLLLFAGLTPVAFPAYPVTQHLAEKLHAYTLPRNQENTRVRDLVDLVIIAATERVDAVSLARSVEATFEVRASHPIPGRLPVPPDSWAQPFARIAAEVGSLPARSLTEGFAFAAAFWDPFLANRSSRQSWLPEQRCWIAGW